MKEVHICSGIIIDDLRRILLIKRKYNKKDYPNHWAVPGGKQDIGESFEETVIREVKEEVGLDFKVDRLFIENDLIFEEEGRINHFHRYLGSYSGNIRIQDDECDGYGRFNYEETKSLLIYDNMRDIIENLYNKNLIT